MTMLIDTNLDYSFLIVITDGKNNVFYGKEDHIENFFDILDIIFQTYRIDFIHIDQRAFGLYLLDVLTQYCNNNDISLTIIDTDEKNTKIRIDNK